jgi:hypothetical protein
LAKVADCAFANPPYGLYRADLLAEWEAKNIIACDPLAVTSELTDVQKLTVLRSTIP